MLRIEELTGDIYRWIRESGHLSQDEIAEAIGKKRQAISRWENEGQMPTPEEEKILVEKARCTKLTFVEIMCRVLSNLLGRRVMIAPEGQVHYLPTAPRVRAANTYAIYYTRLPSEMKREIDEKLLHGKTLEATTEQMVALIARDVENTIAKAIGQPIST